MYQYLRSLWKSTTEARRNAGNFFRMFLAPPDNFHDASGVA